MGGCYLYCQNTSCGVYLGSLGGDSCSICGWSAGAEDHQISDFDRLEAENKALKAELKQAEDNAEQHEFRANRYSAELEALRSKVVVVPDRDAGGNYYEEGWNACLDELTRLNGKTVSEGLLREATRHLGNWLELHECECEGGFHYCGRDQVAKTHRELRGLLDEWKENGNG